MTEPQPHNGTRADFSIPGTTSQTVLGAWGLFTAVLLVMLGNGLLGTLLGVRAELEGFTTSVTGYVLAFYFVGFLGGASVVPRFVINVGHIRVYAALASLGSTAALVHIITVNPVAWGGARFVTGFAMSGLFIVAESWLSDIATNDTRGKLLSVYMVVQMGGMALSQFLLAAGDAAGVALFIMTSVLVSVAVVPITLSVSPAPEFLVTHKLHFREVWKAAPLGVFAGFANGIAAGALVSLGAVYATRVGMNVTRIALFMGLLLGGSVVLQAPIGIISDRIRRRVAILGLAIITGFASLAMVFIDPLGWQALVVIGVLGGLTIPMYSLALTHISDWVPAGSSVSVSSVYIFITGTGLIIGPILGASMLDSVGPTGLFWLMVGVNVAIAGFAVLRISVRKGMPVAKQGGFAMVPARASGVILTLARRAIKPKGAHIGLRQSRSRKNV